MEDPIIPTCNRLAPLLLIALPVPAAAATVPLSAYVEARAAEMQGDEARSARLFAAIAAAHPADRTITRRAIATAIQSGQSDLAVSLARKLPAAELPIDARLMLAADSLRRGKNRQAVADLEKGITSTEVELFAPLVRAWEQTARGKAAGAAALASLASGSPLAPIADEQRAAMLFALGKADDALPLAQKVVAQGGGRNTRLRLAYADALLRLKRRDQALGMLEGSDEGLAAARARVARGEPLEMAISTPAAGYAEMLVALAVDLSRDENKVLPIALTQVARHANPGNSETTILLALLLDGDGREDDALALLATVRPNDLLAGEALDVETRLLTDRKQYDAALRLARAAAGTADAGPQDYARLANVLGDMGLHAEAAAAYGEAITRSKGPAEDGPLWTLHLLRAASLEQADSWTESKAEVTKAMKLAPDQPLLLNFLGYGKLERGEDLDAAEAMIRKASALAPDDASITDSLGWALFKRGRLAEAIETLTRAAAGIRRRPKSMSIWAMRSTPPAADRGALRLARGPVTAEDEAKSRIEARSSWA